MVNRHPWVYSGAVEETPSGVGQGTLADLLSSEGAWLASGFCRPGSEIVMNILTWDPAEAGAPFEDLLLSRLGRALACRRADPHHPGPGGAFRMVHGDADMLPGLVADWYAGYVVVQLSVPGMDSHREAIAEGLTALTGARGVWERSDTELRKRSGLPPAVGLLCGEAPPAEITVEEAGSRYLVDVRSGHKTGFYLDQSAGRRLCSPWMAGRDVLNCYCYTGSFSIAAAAGGASSAHGIDSSAPAVETAARIAALNGLDPEAFTFECADVPSALRAYGRDGRRFGAVVLDPPRFVNSRNGLARGARAYKDINMRAMEVLEPGGILATFSCSGMVDPGLFRKIVFSASIDAGRPLQVLAVLSQPPDHPVLLSHPQGEYLKGLLLRAF